VTRWTVLAGALLRAAPKRPAVLACVLAPAGILALGSGHAALALELAALALAAGFAPLLAEEPGTAAPAPVSRALRRALVAALCVPALALAWVLVLALASGPSGLATAQLCALTVLAAAACGQASDAGVTAVALSFGAARLVLPERLFPVAAPSSAIAVWLALAVAGGAALALGWRDPAR
jgi:hypothetical protein